jgi:hypothetical protein
MGKETRRTQTTQAKHAVADLRRRDPAADLAENFRRASKALEQAARDVVALRHRVTKPPSR